LLTEIESLVEGGPSIPITETAALPDGTVFFFFRDPDGNVIEFHHPG
jgi:catechol 2,3-dioxygenase-like lactoylglutathione lyase family enzyme